MAISGLERVERGRRGALKVRTSAVGGGQGIGVLTLRIEQVPPRVDEFQRG
jgi:hypothetical protein